MSLPPNPVGRPRKAPQDRAVAATFSAYPKEIGAIASVARAKQYRTTWDYLRALVIADDHPRARGKIIAPRMVEPGTRT